MVEKLKDWTLLSSGMIKLKLASALTEAYQQRFKISLFTYFL